MRSKTLGRLLPLLAAGALAAGCQEAGQEEAGMTEPAAETAREADAPGMVVTVDTQQVHRPDIPIVPHEPAGD